MTNGPSAKANDTVQVSEPTFSVIVVTHNDRRSVPGFIESVERQSGGLDDVQIIAIDTGSDDGTQKQLRDWAGRSSRLGEIVIRDGASLADARNEAIACARGAWVTFPNPDVRLDTEYFVRIRRFIAAEPAAEMLATARRTLNQRTGEVLDDDPLRQMFAGGDQLVDLDRFPDYFHHDLGTAVFRSSAIRERCLRFRDFPVSGSLFCNEYLLGCEKRLVGYVASALSVGPFKPFDNVPGSTDALPPLESYANLLERGAQAHSAAPEWLQRAVVDALAICFREDARARGGYSAIKYATANELRDALRRVTAYIDDHVIASYTARGFNGERRDILLHGSEGSSWHTPYAVADRYDELQRKVRISYRFVGEMPNEVFLLRGKEIPSEDSKIRSCEYFGHALIYERIAWVNAEGTLRVVLDGVPVELRRGWQSSIRTAVRPSQLEQRAKPSRRRLSKQAVRNAAILRLAGSRFVRARFEDAWVLMDRMHESGDNAERLFEYLRSQRRDINAWFVIERDTADWRRLRRGRHRRRVVAYGSFDWLLLMLNCTNMISSHVHDAIRRPREVREIREPGWRFTFLQHGVIKDDISRWLNRLGIDVFVASTPQEYQSVTADYTPYVFTSKEVCLSGLPRFDRLMRLSSRVDVSQRRLILVCPTWRDWLCQPMVPGSQRRPLVEDFMDSEYVRLWMAFLADERLVRHTRDKGLEVGFMPHPNFQSALSDLRLPSHVRIYTYADHDVQELIARSAVMVTDYSSIAFNQAYVDRPVVYFQFDADRMASGEHNFRPGYFDYEADGFGPVAPSVEAAVDAVIEVSALPGGGPPQMYQDRIDKTFPVRDGRCCERVTAAILRSGGRLPAEGPGHRGPSVVRRRAGQLRSGIRRRLARHPRVRRALAAVRRRVRS